MKSLKIKKKKMENSKQALRSVLKYFLSYVMIVLILSPLIIYGVGFGVDQYILGNEAAYDSVMNSNLLDDLILIIGNLLIIILFIKKKYTNLNLSENLFRRISKYKNVFLWACILELSSILPINLFVASLDLNDYSQAIATQETMGVLSVLGACLFAPLAEELVMRGGIEEKLLQWKSNATIAILLSSFLFAILHVYPSFIIGTFLSALLTGWVYYRTRDVWVCFFMHFTNNAVSCLVDWLRPEDNIGPDSIFQTKILIIAIFSLFFMVASISNLKRKTSV